MSATSRRISRAVFSFQKQSADCAERAADILAEKAKRKTQGTCPAAKTKGSGSKLMRSRAGAIQKVNAEIEHAGRSRKRERKFACVLLQSI